jgi:hypothetical protein
MRRERLSLTVFCHHFVTGEEIPTGIAVTVGLASRLFVTGPEPCKKAERHRTSLAFKVVCDQATLISYFLRFLKSERSRVGAASK